jgi:hypothetical protein
MSVRPSDWFCASVHNCADCTGLVMVVLVVLTLFIETGTSHVVATVPFTICVTCKTTVRVFRSKNSLKDALGSIIARVRLLQGVNYCKGSIVRACSHTCTAVNR